MTVKSSLFYSSIFLLLLGLQTARAQSDNYRYKLNLNDVVEDKIQVELETPEIESKTIRFYMPNIVPGTYMESNYGMFVSELKAYDKRGRELPVAKVDTNSWQIDKASKMTRLTYWVEDTYDTKIPNKVYGMSGTNIEAGKNFVIHTPGFFGYFEDMKEQPYEVTITKPESFYGSTGLIPVSTTATSDVYQTDDYDLLMDSPMMYNVPDTTVIDVANAKVLVSVYSPHKQVQAKYVAQQLQSLLEAQSEYLGGRLPVDKYAFIMYFADPSTVQSGTGALEHSYSSLYYLGEMPQQQIASTLVDIASHEFLHIVTPLNIHSEEIAYFNYKEPDLSRHLWLYEGSTEYAAHHVQVKEGMISGREFLQRMADKINTSKESYNDTLAFTELSEKAAGKYSSEYTNVYQKGALIGAMLDIALLDVSDNKMDLRDLMAQLSKRYGKKQPFEDDKLFSVIASMTDPAIGTFFDRYVAGSETLPYEEYFAKAGVVFGREPDQMVATLGNVGIGYNPQEQRLFIADTSGMNAFGKTMGYQPGDLIISLQGQDFQPTAAQALLDEYSKSTQEGDTVEVIVKRKNEDGTYQEMTLQASAMLVNKPGKYTLEFAKNPTYEQLKLRNNWLYKDVVTARPGDVASIDAIITSLYDVISGPAGPRDWERNASLFKPEATMAAFGKDKGGELVYVTMTQDEYRQRNEPFFMENGFWEEEIGRKVFRFGEIATVQTAYQYRLKEDGEAEQRGVNSVQLVFDEGRWWITNITWNSEREDNPIPDELLTEKASS